jgi:hypothetical protein
MNTDDSERRLKAIFNELKAEDLRRTPPFDDIARASRSAASSSHVVFPRFRLALGTTAVALLIAGVALSAIRLHKHSVEKEIQQWQAVSEWQAPTDALLNAQDAPR